MKIGIIGAGPNAAGHAKYYAINPRSTVVAIADIDTQRAQSLADEVGARAVADYKEFLADVDAVIVSSPNFLHKEHAIACAQAGKHVYCEKPMGLSFEDAKEIEAAIRTAGVASTVGFTVRFDSYMQAIKEKIDSGEIGDIFSLHSRRIMFFNPLGIGGWRFNSKLSGGELFEISLHELDWMLSLGGEVKSVYARSWAHDTEDKRANDHIWVTLNYQAGAVGTHEGGWSTGHSVFHRSVIGTKGAAHTNEWGSEVYFSEHGQERKTLPEHANFDLRGHFLDCIEQKIEPVADAAWALKVMAVAEAIIESAASGQVVAVTQPVSAHE